MYIDPFLAGVLATIFGELVVFALLVVVCAVNGGKDENEDHF